MHAVDAWSSSHHSQGMLQITVHISQCWQRSAHHTWLPRHDLGCGYKETRCECSKTNREGCDLDTPRTKNPGVYRDHTSFSLNSIWVSRKLYVRNVGDFSTISPRAVLLRVSGYHYFFFFAAAAFFASIIALNLSRAAACLSVPAALPLGGTALPLGGTALPPAGFLASAMIVK